MDKIISFDQYYRKKHLSPLLELYESCALKVYYSCMPYISPGEPLTVREYFLDGSVQEHKLAGDFENIARYINSNEHIKLFYFCEAPVLCTFGKVIGSCVDMDYLEQLKISMEEMQNGPITYIT